jgi:hypothetical protein
MATQTVIAAVIHELLKQQAFTDYTDFVETVKERCAKLRLRYDAGSVSDAIRVVERTRPVLQPPRHSPAIRPVTRESLPVSRAEAARILAGLGIRL